MDLLKEMRIEKPSLVMFDLDGTLVDSVPDLTRAVDLMLRDMGRSEVGKDVVAKWVGNGAAMLVKRALSNAMQPKNIESSEFNCAYELFFKHYEQENGNFSRLYPGVQDTLFEIRKNTRYLALVTNKPKQFTPTLLQKLDIDCFDLVLSGDSLPFKKPDPAPLLHCLQSFRCEPSQALMVGDSKSDILAAQAANVPVVCVSYGYHQGENLEALKPDWLIERFEQLMDLERVII